MPRRKTHDDRIYQLRIDLDGASPPIWRRLLVPGSTTLATLHEVIQAAFDWEGYHLHLFDVGGVRYSDPELADDLGTGDEAQVLLATVAPREKMKFLYEYDFGDSWQHTILVEKLLDREPGARYPRCVKAQRAAPPEDVGGIWGYEALLEVLADPSHEEHEEAAEWFDDGFDPAHVDLDEINARLARLA